MANYWKSVKNEIQHDGGDDHDDAKFGRLFGPRLSAEQAQHDNQTNGRGAHAARVRVCALHVVP